MLTEDTNREDANGEDANRKMPTNRSPAKVGKHCEPFFVFEKLNLTKSRMANYQQKSSMSLPVTDRANTIGFEIRTNSFVDISRQPASDMKVID